MAPKDLTISQLRAQLAEARVQLNKDFRLLETHLDLPGRMRDEVAAHPFRWLAVSAAAGGLAAKIIPALWRGPGTQIAKGFLPMALRAVAMSAMPFVATLITRMRPDSSAQGSP